MQMIALILKKLPKHLYSMFISNYSLNGYANMSLHTFQNKLRDFWLQNVKAKSIEHAMTVEVKEKEIVPAEVLKIFNDQIKGLTDMVQELKSS